MFVKIQKNHMTFSFIVNKEITNVESFKDLIRKLGEHSVAVFLDDFKTLYEGDLIQFNKFVNVEDIYHITVNL